MNNDYFVREVKPCDHDPRILIDSELRNNEYVESFGFEWTEIDGFVGKESMSHGHIFGRFLLPDGFVGTVSLRGRNFDSGFAWRFQSQIPLTVI